MFGALAALARRHARLVLLATMGLTVIAGVFGAGVGERLGVGGTTDDSSESSRVAAIIAESDPAADVDIMLVVTAPGDVDDRQVAATGLAITDELANTPGVEGVQSYWRTPVDALRSTDSTSALVTAHFGGTAVEANDMLPALDERLDEFRADDVQIVVAGPEAIRQELQATIGEDLIRAELVALPIALVILYVVFGGVLAAMLPLLTGVVAILGTNAVLRVISEFTDVSVFATNLTTALGLGLAIDYALLILRRHREELAKGLPPARAIRVTLETAGRTVLFSALTVAAALSSMLVFPLYFLRSFAYAGIAVVALSTFCALVVLPAAIMALGDRLRRKASVRANPATDRPLSGRWARWALASMRHRFVAAGIVVAVLGAVALPFTGVVFGQADDRQLPDNSAVREAQDLVRHGFDSQARPLATVVLPAGTTDDDLAKVREILTADDRVSSISGAEPADGRDAGLGARDMERPAFISVSGASGVEPTSEAAQHLVRDLRADLAGTDALVGGQPAEIVDSLDAIGDGMPLALVIVIGSALVLVFLLTGSVILPLQAVLANGLSLTAMLGASVWVFQDGNLAGLLGFTPTGYIESTIPILMSCVAFGLAMDYGVFVLARIVEERRTAPDDATAVAVALQHTGGVVTAAALILSTVLIAIGTSRVTNTMMLGLGVALAVLVDAVVVRSTLVPALVAITGKATWWAPGPLRRFHERHGWREEVEGPLDDEAVSDDRELAGVGR